MTEATNLIKSNKNNNENNDDNNDNNDSNNDKKDSDENSNTNENKNKNKVFVDVADMDPSSGIWDHNYKTNKNTNIDNHKNKDDYDNKLDKEGQKEVVKVVLYGVLGSTSFCDVHKMLKIKADSSYVRYTVRHGTHNLAPSSKVRTNNIVWTDIVLNNSINCKKM